MRAGAGVRNCPPAGCGQAVPRDRCAGDIPSTSGQMCESLGLGCTARNGRGSPSASSRPRRLPFPTPCAHPSVASETLTGNVRPGPKGHASLSSSECPLQTNPFPRQRKADKRGVWCPHPQATVTRLFPPGPAVSLVTENRSAAPSAPMTFLVVMPTPWGLKCPRTSFCPEA